MLTSYLLTSTFHLIQYTKDIRYQHTSTCCGNCINACMYEVLTIIYDVHFYSYNDNNYIIATYFYTLITINKAVQLIFNT